MANHTIETQENAIKPGLYIVATPIGNLGDITARAVETLKSVDYILCEDTRVTSKLLHLFGIKTKLETYHDHNGHIMRPKVLNWLNEGASVALVSDAGTPLICDPGYKLVAEAKGEGHDIVAVPGPSALTAALSIAGLATDRFLFLGFPPNKSKARQDWFQTVAALDVTLVFYESNHRLKDCLSDAEKILLDREAVICREITKKFEETIEGSLAELSTIYHEKGNPKGEIVVVVGPPPKKEAASDIGAENNDLDIALLSLIGEHGVKKTAMIMSNITGLSKNQLYTRCQTLKDQSPKGSDQ